MGSFIILVSFSLLGPSTVFFSQKVNAQAQTTTISQEQLYKTMAEISNSDKPRDIGTLAYLWGY